MPFNGSGIFTRAYNWVQDSLASLDILPARMDGDANDIANGLSNCVTRDGQSPATADLPMGGHKHTNVGNAAGRNQYPSVGQVQDGSFTYLTSVSGVDTITASASVSPAAYAAGQRFTLMPAGTNATSSVTLNVSGLGAVAVWYQGAPILPGAIASGQLADFEYDGTHFELLNPLVTSALATRMQYSLTASQATTSGTAVDFTSIPSWAKRITVMLAGVSTNGSSAVTLQIGSGSIDVTGYLGSGGYAGAASAAGLMTNGFATETASGATVVRHGHCTLTHMGGNVWVFSSVHGRSDSNYMHISGGSKSLSGVLDRIRLTATNLTDAFDAGSVSVLIEG